LACSIGVDERPEGARERRRTPCAPPRGLGPPPRGGRPTAAGEVFEGDDASRGSTRPAPPPVQAPRAPCRRRSRRGRRGTSRSSSASPPTPSPSPEGAPPSPGGGGGAALPPASPSNGALHRGSLCPSSTKPVGPLPLLPVQKIPDDRRLLFCFTLGRISRSIDSDSETVTNKEEFSTNTPFRIAASRTGCALIRGRGPLLS
jgi:hypothetical protein